MDSLSENLVWGDGPTTSRVMIIGEAPGETEDREGKPFVGRAGKLLNEALEEAGLPRSSVYVTNLVKSRPPNNRRPTEKEITEHVEYLIDEYKTIQPEFVLILGNTVLHALTNFQGGISTHRGYIDRNKTAMPRACMFATFHPSAALRSTATRELFKADILIFANKVKGSYKDELVSDE